jgi:hypothetical protein
MTRAATMQWGHPQPRSGEGDAMRWGYLPLAGESGAHDPRGDDAERSDEVGVPPACGGERRP